MKEEAYRKIFTDIESAGKVEGGCIVSRDGLLIYSSMDKIHAEAFAAMLATLLSSAEVAMDEIGAGVPKKVIVEGREKKIMVTGAGPHALLAIVVEDGDEMEEVLLEGAKKVEEILRDRK